MNKIFVGIPSGTSIPISLWNSYGDAVRLRNGDKIQHYNIRGTNAVSARNSCVYEMLQGDYTHLLFFDSDMAFPENTLQKLLDHDKDIVGGFYVRKREEFAPTVFKLGERPEGKFVTEWINDFKEVEAIGTGCLLIKREVFENIECPWFEYKWNGSPDGKMITEDLVFCEKAKEAGYKIYCDGTIKCGHVNSMVIWPQETVMTNRIEPI